MAEGKGVLCLDHGLRLGWAWTDQQPDALRSLLAVDQYRSGSVDLDFRRTLADYGGAYVKHESWLTAKLAELPTRVIVFESPVPFSGGGSANRIMTGLAAITELVTRRSEIPTFEKANNTVKKFATGHGHTQKHQMLAAARARGWDVHDHNECDALWLLAYVIEQGLALPRRTA